MASLKPLARLALPLLAIAALAPCTSHAQQVGIYAGKEANGASISISVVEDTYLHELAIAGMTSLVVAHCRDKVGYGAVTTIAPSLVPFTGNTAEYRWNFGTYYIDATLTFDNDTNTVSGDIVSYNVIFGGQKQGVPTSATFCTDASQHFDAILTPGSSLNPKADAVLTKGWRP